MSTTKNATPFIIGYIDHVAIRVKDLPTSAAWYQHVLGLQQTQFEAWGDYPIFMMSGNFGVALFPAKADDPLLPTSSRNVKIDHFAFNVSQEDFHLAQAYFTEIGETFHFQDHTYYHSIYLRDPDQHTVELTTLVATS